MEIEKLLDALRSGKPLILFDSPNREGEADIIIHAKYCVPDMVRLLRKDAGGMICLATSSYVAKKMDLIFYADYLRKFGTEGMKKLAIKRTAYGDEPSFCTFINSRKVYTGISDNDRSMTIREFEKMIGQNNENDFANLFYAPGHVPLLISRGIENRRGHTEYAVELAEKAGMSAAVVICEMLADDGKALSWEKAKEYAEKNRFIAIDGKELLNLL